MTNQPCSKAQCYKQACMRPVRADCAMTKRLSGPGESARMSDVVKNARSTLLSIMRAICFCYEEKGKYNIFVAVDTENVSQVSLFRQKKEAYHQTGKQNLPALKARLSTQHTRKKRTSTTENVKSQPGYRGILSLPRPDLLQKLLRQHLWKQKRTLYQT